MTFYDCLMACAENEELVLQFNRLTKRKVGVSTLRTPLEKLIDASTGYQAMLDAQAEDDLRAFIDFCHDAVWCRLPVAA